MSRYHLSEVAKADLESIWDFIGVAKDNPDAAQRQVEAIFEKLSFLARNPRVGQQRDDLRPEIRVFQPVAM